MTARTLVLSAFVVVNLGLLIATGLHTAGDTGLYLDGARRLLEGIPLSGRQPSYFGYIAVIAAAQAIGVGLLGVVLLQVALATVATAVVYRLGATLGGPRAGVVAAALVTADLETNRWHGYVLADSLYLSAFTASAWLVYRAGDEQRDWRPHVLALIALAVAASLRPEGWFVIPAALIYWMARSEATRSRHWAGLAVLGVLSVALVIVAAPGLAGSLEPVGPGEMLRRGQTIWNYEGWRLSMPEASPFGEGWDGLRNALVFALSHPISTVTLMIARVCVHLIHVRPFYSTAHNLAIVMWLTPVYLFAAYGAWVHRRHSLVLWCAAAIGTQTLVVSLTHAESDGRYLAHVLPLIYPFTASGLVLVLSHRNDRSAD